MLALKNHSSGVRVHSLWLILIVLISSACNGPKTENEQTLDRLNQKELQYYSNGKQLYTKYCQNCHMSKGEGMNFLIPPLAKADYLMSDLKRAAKIIKYGQKGPITVNQIEFNQPMPANPRMTNSEIQEIITYISNAWGNQAQVLSVEEVAEALKED